MKSPVLKKIGKVFTCKGALASSLALLLLLAVSMPSHAASLIRGLGGASGFGTQAMYGNDDGASQSLVLGAGFPNGVNFFGMTYSTFYINNNGNLTFRGPLYNYTPTPFPISSQPMIAPFWGDVDTRYTYYGDTTKNNVYYARVGNKIYITWNYVGYYSYHNDKLNGFQAVLTDRSDVSPGDFDVDFRYEQLQWTTGDASGGYYGLGGTPAQMGFDAGDLTHFYSHPDSQTARILNLVTTSNVNDPGVWHFEVRSGIVKPNPVPVLKDVKVIDTISTTGIDLDLTSFSKTPDSITSVGGNTVIQWSYPTFSADKVDDFHFDVILKNPQGGEKRLVYQKLELTYTDANGNPARTELGQGYVNVLPSVFDSSLSTDKPQYHANDNCLIAAMVKNAGDYSRTVDARILVEDSAGNLIREAAVLPGLFFAAGEVKSLPATYAVGTQYAGDYRARLVLYENGGAIAEVTTPFKILPDKVASSAVSTDKSSYNANEPVSITSLVKSGSSNYILSELTATLTLSDSAGNRLFSDQRGIKSLLQGQSSELKSVWNTASHPKGKYTVALEVRDASGLLSTATTSFGINGTGTTGGGVTGTISAQPTPVELGEQERIAYSVTNNGNENILNLPVSVLIADAATLEVKQTIPVPVSLSVGGTIGENTTVSTADLNPGQYLALLTATPPGSDVKTLARANFEVVIPKPKLEVTKSVSGIGNLLVWLNYPWTSGEHCPDRAVIERALRESGVLYRVVTDKKDFESELHNQLYTDFLILGDQLPIEDHISEMLREQVYQGKGLAASIFSRLNLNEAVLGLKTVGELSGSSYPVQLLSSPISGGGSFQSTGRAMKIEVVNQGEVSGWITDLNNKTALQYPAAVVRQYGEGRVVYLAFDLGMSSANYDSFAALLAGTLRSIHRGGSPQSLRPGQLVPVELTIQARGGGFNLTSAESYPAAVGLYQLPMQQIADNPWTSAFSLATDEKKTILYYALLPAQKGSWALESGISYSLDGLWKEYGSYPLELAVAQDEGELAAAVAVELGTLHPLTNKENADVADALNSLQKVSVQGSYSAAELDGIVHELLKAVDAVVDIQTADTGVVRKDLDTLLAIYAAKWYQLQ